MNRNNIKKVISLIIIFIQLTIPLFCNGQSTIDKLKVDYNKKLAKSKNLEFYVMLRCNSDSVSVSLCGEVILQKLCIRNPVDDNPIFLGKYTVNQERITLDVDFHRHKKRFKKEVELTGNKVIIYACITEKEKEAFKEIGHKNAEEVIIAEEKNQVKIFVK